ncbi:MAG TPA: sporulation integral membrane protein YtvI [Clostridiales bacterium]|jgi:sporulation integral membrane protein YtvI|nr:sporulation integral membrane protein YtvI [Clostridiales bacterium]
MNLNTKKAFIINVVYFAVLLAFVYIGIKYLLPLLMPFIIGIIIAICFRRPIDMLHKKIHIKRSFISIFVLIVFYGIIGTLVSLIGFKVFEFVRDLFYGLPELYKNTIHPALLSTLDNIVLNSPGLESYLDEFVSNLSSSITSYLTTASTTVVETLTGMAGRLPSLLIKLIFTIVSSFFFTIDYYKISDFLIEQFSGERKKIVLNLKDNVLGTLGKFIRAYAAIISITFLELSFGFFILGIPNAFLFGALIAFIDILPILGTGAVLLPWSIISFILGNAKLGFGMLILYIIITAVRQTIEPKIVGQQIGLHPIITLILMFVGAQLMGVLGLLLLPVIATIIKKFNDEGTIHIIKYPKN